MKRATLAWAVILAAGLAGAAPAVIGAIDQVPAATLLLPYFEVDLGDPTGITTLFSINNASATAALAHVVVWSDLSVPVLDFNVYLTGYDVQTINLRDILTRGALPQTASAGQDPGDAISPQGAFSQDIDFASCQGQLPPPTLPASFIAHLQAALTGQLSSLLGGCAGTAWGDNVARGYVTVDAVDNCTLRFPGDAGYFAPGGTGDATDDNRLWGDYFFLAPDRAGDFAAGDTLVHIEASASDPRVTTPGRYTFYGRYDGWTASDNREPLATSFAVRYFDGGHYGGGTDLVVWRDSKTAQGAFKCGTLPAWFPLSQEGLVIFDEQEHPQVPQSIPVSPPPPVEGLQPFPREAQRTTVGGPDLPVPFAAGWLYLDLNTTVSGNPNPPIDPAAAQAWVAVLLHAIDPYQVGFDAIQLDNASAALHTTPGASPCARSGTTFCR